MATPAGNLFVNLSANAAEFGQQMKRAEKDVTGFRARSNQALAKFQRKVQDVRKGLMSWQAAAGAAAGAAGMGILIDRTLESAQQLENLSRQTGFSVKRIQELRFAAEATGVQTASLDDGLAELAQRMGEAAADGGEMAEGFKAAGVAIDGLEKRRPGAVFNEIADAISNAESRSEALNIAVKTFGDEAGREMVAVLRRGSDGLEEMARRARELGFVMSEDTVQGASEAADQLDVLKQVVTIQFTKAIAELGPDIADFTSTLANNTDTIKNFAQDLGDLAGAAVDAGKGFVWLTSNVKEGLQVLGAVETDQFTQLTTQMEDLRTRRDRVVGQLQKNLPDRVEDQLRTSLKKMNSRLTELQNRRRRLMEEQGDIPTPEPPEIGGGGVARDVATGGSDIRLPSAGQLDTLSSIGRNQRAPGFIAQENEEAKKRLALLEDLGGEMNRQASRQSRLNAMLADGAITADRFFDEMLGGSEASQKNLEDLQEEGKSLGETLQLATAGWANDFSKTLTNLLFEADTTFAEIAESFGRMITRMVIQQQVIQPVLKGFGVTSSAAQGHAYENGVEKFAQGGVVDRPTVFPMARGAGLMGESGPEAVMPLERTRGGDLGVRAQGAGVEVNVINQSGADAQVQEQQTQGGGRRIDVIIDGQVAQLVSDPGSKTHQAITRSTTARSNSAVR